MPVAAQSICLDWIRSRPVDFVVGHTGTGFLNMDGGAINLTANTSTTNSAYTSIHNLDPNAAQDGNVVLGNDATGNGTVAQTGGTITANGNIIVGLMDPAIGRKPAVRIWSV